MVVFNQKNPTQNFKIFGPKVTPQEFLLFLKRKEKREPFSLIPFEFFLSQNGSLINHIVLYGYFPLFLSQQSKV
jgi:hypothetical protein